LHGGVGPLGEGEQNTAQWKGRVTDLEFHWRALTMLKTDNNHAERKGRVVFGPGLKRWGGVVRISGTQCIW